MVGARLVEVFLVFLGDGTVFLAAKRHTVVTLKPVAEGVGVNLNNGILDKSVGTDQLVVGCVVND